MANAIPRGGLNFIDGSAVCDSADSMIWLGEQFGQHLETGLVLSLDGPIGAGKTHFVKGLVRGVGSPAEVTSPTFTLVHEYDGGRVPIVHFDWYRLEDSDGLEAIGFSDYLDPCDAILAIEWGSKFPEVLPQAALRLKIRIDGDLRHVEWRAGF